MTTARRSRHASPTFAIPSELHGVKCPHCNGDGVSVASLFGGSVSEILLQCDACHSFFHWVKWRGGQA